MALSLPDKNIAVRMSCAPYHYVLPSKTENISRLKTKAMRFGRCFLLDTKIVGIPINAEKYLARQ